MRRLYRSMIIMLVAALPVGGVQARACVPDNDMAVGEETPAAEVTGDNHGFWHHGVGKLLKSADDMLKRWEESDIDTNYIRTPKYDRMIYVGGYGYYQRHNMDFPIMVSEVDMPALLQNYIPSNYNDNRYLSTAMHTTQTEMQIGIDWRGLAIDFPITLVNKFSHSFGLAKNGSVWGFRLRYKHLNDMQGYVENAFENTVDEMVGRYRANKALGDPTEFVNHDPVEVSRRNLENGDMNLKVLYAEGYYVFNHRQFSLGAGMFADMVQRRPAGSFFLMANYYQSQLLCNDLLNFSHDRFRSHKMSVGAGYGYNLPYLDGRLCFHFSVIPMIALVNNVKHDGWDEPDVVYDENPETNELIITLARNYDEHFYDACEYGRDSKFTVNGFSRFAVNYSFDCYAITFVANYRQYLFSSSSGMKIGNRDLDAQFNFCWRF